MHILLESDNILNDYQIFAISFDKSDKRSNPSNTLALVQKIYSVRYLYTS